MSLPSNAGRRTTRSDKLLDKSNKEQKEVFTTPMKDNDKTPASSTAKKSSSHATPTEKSKICSICQNSIKLRNNFLENSVESIIDKINTACETFSDSMAQVESLGLNIRHFLISDGDKSLTYEKTLSKLSQDIADFEERWNNMNASMNANNDHLKHISDNITSLKNDQEVASSSYIDKIDQKLSDIDKLFKESAALSHFPDYRPHYGRQRINQLFQSKTVTVTLH